MYVRNKVKGAKRFSPRFTTSRRSLGYLGYIPVYLVYNCKEEEELLTLVRNVEG